LRVQQKPMPVIGFLGPFPPAMNAQIELELAAFREGLSETGYLEGQNVTIEYRRAEGHHDRLPGLAAELVARKVDVIATTGGAVSAQAAKSTTSTIPIVFTSVGGDPVEAGLVASFSRPGGNATGISTMGTQLNPKRLGLLSELVPQARVIALLVNPNNLNIERTIRDVKEAARAKGVQLPVLKGGAESEIDAAFPTSSNFHAGALVVGPDQFFLSRREQLVALAAPHAVPAIYGQRDYASAGKFVESILGLRSNNQSLLKDCTQ
jgi:putative ABC transport system substrate-binding protein